MKELKVKEYSTMRGYYPSNASHIERFTLFQQYHSYSPPQLARLVEVLQNSIRIAFVNYAEFGLFEKNEEKLLKSVALLNTELKATSRVECDLQNVSILRRQAITELIYDLFNLLESFRQYYVTSAEASSFENFLVRNPSREKFLIKEQKIFSKRFAVPFKTQLSLQALAAFNQRDFRNQNYYIELNVKHISEPFHKAFSYSFNLDGTAPASPIQEEASVVQELSKLMCDFPTELRSAYTEAEALRAEILTVENIAIEDEYFVEQISESYYPSILSSLKSVPVRGSVQKDALVQEILKQLNSIQLGLHQISDKAVEQHMSEVKAQTAFLQNKVLNTHSLSLSTATLDTTVEETLSLAKDAKKEKTDGETVTPVSPNAIEKAREEVEQSDQFDICSKNYEPWKWDKNNTLIADDPRTRTRLRHKAHYYPEDMWDVLEELS